jgi:ADP-ribosylglycohydrolase
MEFMSLDQIKSRFGSAGIKDLPEPALFSEDSQMTIAVAEALVEASHGNLDSIMETTKNEFVKWRHSPENNRAPGNTCLAGVPNMERGVHWLESGMPDSKGCGSAMRVAPIGYFYQNDQEKLKTIARASGICTHGHRTAIAASLVAAYLIKLALYGGPHDRMMSDLLDFTHGIFTGIRQGHLEDGRVPWWKDEEEALNTSARAGSGRRQSPWRCTVF